MSYKELKDFMNSLSDDDLKQPAKVCYDGYYHEIEFVNEESDIDGYAVLVAKMERIPIKDNQE